MMSPWIATDKQGMYRRSDITGIFHTVRDVSNNRVGKLGYENADYLVIWNFERSEGLRTVEALRVTASKPFNPVEAEPLLKKADALLARQLEVANSDISLIIRTFLSKDAYGEHFDLGDLTA